VKQPAPGVHSRVECVDARKTTVKMGGSCGVELDGRTGSRFWLELVSVT